MALEALSSILFVSPAQLLAFDVLILDLFADETRNSPYLFTMSNPPSVMPSATQRSAPASLSVQAYPQSWNRQLASSAPLRVEIPPFRWLHSLRPE